MAKPDVPMVRNPEAKRYVTIPDTDLFDQPHPAIKINQHSFGPGTYYLESALADTVEERLKAYTRANVRILQPKRDLEAERLIGQFGQGGSAGVATTDIG